MQFLEAKLKHLMILLSQGVLFGKAAFLHTEFYTFFIGNEIELLNLDDPRAYSQRRCNFINSILLDSPEHGTLRTLFLLDLDALYGHLLLGTPLQEIHIAETAIEAVELMDEAGVGLAEDVEHCGEGAEDYLQGQSSVVIGMMREMEVELVVILL